MRVRWSRRKTCSNKTAASERSTLTANYETHPKTHSLLISASPEKISISSARVPDFLLKVQNSPAMKSINLTNERAVLLCLLNGVSHIESPFGQSLSAQVPCSTHPPFDRSTPRRKSKSMRMPMLIPPSASSTAPKPCSLRARLASINLSAVEPKGVMSDRQPISVWLGQDSLSQRATHGMDAQKSQPPIIHSPSDCLMLSVSFLICIRSLKTLLWRSLSRCFCVCQTCWTRVIPRPLRPRELQSTYLMRRNCAEHGGLSLPPYPFLQLFA